MTAPHNTRSKAAAALAVVVVALTACSTPAPSVGDTTMNRTPSSAAPRDTAGPGCPSVVDWSAIQDGDKVPTCAFTEPAPRPAYAKSLAVQERRLKNRDRVVIPSMNAVAPIASSPVVDGNAVIPKGGQVGWITTTARPGGEVCAPGDPAARLGLGCGVTVLAGHRDVRKGANAGPLHKAERLPRGATVRVVWHGKTTTYAVTKVTKHARHDLPPTLFDPNGPNRLALITCTDPYVGRDDDGDGDADSSWLSRNAVIWAERIQ